VFALSDVMYLLRLRLLCFALVVFVFALCLCLLCVSSCVLCLPISKVQMRFVEASIGSGSVPQEAVSKQPISDLLAQLTKSFIDLRQETKKNAETNREREQAIFKALTQRQETDMHNIFENCANMAKERCETLENHINEAMNIERLTVEERNKRHAETIQVLVLFLFLFSLFEICFRVWDSPPPVKQPQNCKIVRFS